jgi:glycosyltransferase involved in cell wall biosynthesis
LDELVFILPGDPSSATGGYVYDRRICDGLRTLGWTVDVRNLDESFPDPTPEALAHAARVLAHVPDGALVLIDGLALGAMPDAIAAEARRLRLAALVHHPLAEETGLDSDRLEALRDSERRALTATTRVVVTSGYTARLLSDYGVPSSRIRVIEPGTDPAPLAPGSGSDRLELLCVATLTRRKGHRLLLEALASLRDRRWHLTCVGSPERDPQSAAEVRDRIEALGLKKRITLAGELDDAALAACYDRADAFVLPTWFEGYGMSLAEALARGLPVVSTLGGAVPQTVPRGACLLVPPGDVAALAKALSLLMDEPDLRAALAAGAREARRLLPTWDQACARMAEVLREIALA